MVDNWPSDPYYRVRTLMNSATTFKLSTTAPSETDRLGKVIGRLLRRGTVIELAGDVGSGKTTLAKGIIAGMGFLENAPSPTFTVGRVYPVREGLQLHHFDFYRLHGADMATEELAEVLQDPEAVVVVEWADSGRVQLPVERLRMTAALGAGEDERTLVVESLDRKLNYVVEELRRAYRSKD